MMDDEPRRISDLRFEISEDEEEKGGKGRFDKGLDKGHARVRSGRTESRVRLTRDVAAERMQALRHRSLAHK
jgi:hypothetical protein